MDKEQYKYDVFLSSSSKDRSFVDAICEKLEKSGMKVFYSNKNQHPDPGHSIVNALGNALKESKCFVLICTPNAVKSNWVKRECEVFFSQFFMNSNEGERRFFILKGKGYDESLKLKLPVMVRDFLEVGSIDEIIKALVDNDAGNLGNPEYPLPGTSKSKRVTTRLKKSKVQKKKGIVKRFLLLLLIAILSTSIFVVIKKLVYSQKKIHVTNLSFIGGDTHSPISNRELRATIDEAVIEGMNMAKSPFVNHFSFKISDISKDMERFVSIMFDPNLTNGNKIEKIIEELMVPKSIDAIVSGLYIPQESSVTVRPLVIIKKSKVVATKNLQFSKSELFRRDPIRREKILFKDADRQIASAVKELIIQYKLENIFIKEFPFIYVKTSTIPSEYDYSLMKNKEEEELIRKSVLRGIDNGTGKKNLSEKLVINGPGHTIRNTDANIKYLFSVFFDENLSDNDKIYRIINRLMVPNNVDVIVTGQYIKSVDDSIITICPLVIVKSLEEIFFKPLQFSREEVECTDPVNKKEILCKAVFDRIAQAVQELLEQL